MCLAGEYPRAVADLAGRAPTLAVRADYLTRMPAQPHSVSQLSQTRAWVGVDPVVLSSDA